MLGSNIVRQLRAGGHRVTALVRSVEKAQRQFAGLDVEVVVGDIDNIAGFAGALDGCDVVFHTAAYFRESFALGEHWPTLQRLNIDATVALIAAAEERKVPTFVHISSSGVIGMHPGQTIGDESSVPDAPVFESPYFKSKLLCEQAIAKIIPTAKINIIQILPGWMMGPGDDAPTAAGRLVVDMLNQQLPAIIPGGGALVDTRDVATATIRAATHGQHGERYIVGGDTFRSLGQIATLVEQASGVPAPRIHLPWPVALAMATVVEQLGRLRGEQPLMTVRGIRTLRAVRRTSSAKAIRELGATFRPIEETVRDTVAWYRANRRDMLSARALVAG
jgi:dihydroflavonol-4-reductase